jgi:hypothetical protein
MAVRRPRGSKGKSGGEQFRRGGLAGPFFTLRCTDNEVLSGMPNSVYFACRAAHYRQLASSSIGEGKAAALPSPNPGLDACRKH